jgi:FkbM family methyltransferase
MHVEECCSALLNYILPQVDRTKSGITIEIGVGTFHFYCSLFKKLGFEVIAVEPIPNEDLKALCRKQNIKLIESCITKIDGPMDIYMGTWQGEENTNLCSTRSDWWGTTSETKQVESISLSTLLKSIQKQAITCIKIDVEGAEVDIIEQFLDVTQGSLPLVLMFEYGGGTTKNTQQGGWSPEIYNGTLRCLEVLKSLKYREIIAIDSSENFVSKVYDLQNLSSFEDIFPETSNYGNIIATCDRILSQLDLYPIVSLYGDNYSPVQSPQIETTIFRKVANKLKNLFL